MLVLSFNELVIVCFLNVDVFRLLVSFVVLVVLGYFVCLLTWLF